MPRISLEVEVNDAWVIRPWYTDDTAVFVYVREKAHAILDY